MPSPSEEEYSNPHYTKTGCNFAEMFSDVGEEERMETIKGSDGDGQKINPHDKQKMS